MVSSSPRTELPDGWVSESIDSLAEPKGVAYGVLKPGPRTPQGVPMLRVTDVRGGKIDQLALYRISSELDREYRRTKLQGGEVVVSIQGSVGRVAVVPLDLSGANISRTLAMIRLRDPGLAAWLHRALEAPDAQAAMTAAIGGTTRDSLNLRDLRKIELPIAPATQRARILAVLEGSLSQGTSCAAHLAASRRAVDRFRQAVLAAACAGRLTADWREGSNASVSADLRSTAVSGTSSELAIPTSWVVARIADVGTVQLGGTPSRTRSDYWSGGVPWVSSGEVANCRIQSTRETISALGLANSSAKIYPAGTVLIAMIGEGKTRGQAAILDIEASTNQNAAGIQAERRFVDPEYLWRWALSEYETTRAVGRGGNQSALNKQKIADLIIPVPPLDEQLQIVRRLDLLLAAAEALSARIDTASRRVEHTSRSVLAKAFRGDLVPSGGQST